MVYLKVDNVGCPHGCNSLGQILFKGEWIPCPIHGNSEKGLLLDGKLPNGGNLFDILQIPYDYRGVWVTDISELFKNQDILENCFRESITQLKYILETLYNQIAIENNLYMNSLFLYANPNLIDLQPYMYTLQRIAFENNIGVLPAITVNDLAGLLALQEYSGITIKSDSDVSYINKLNRLAGQGADWYLRTGLTYTDYLKSSTCFILDNASSLDEHLRLLAGFIEDRGRRGLPTYVFSTAFLDSKRENYLYNKSGTRKLSSLTPYLLLGKNQEFHAREHGWLKNKGSSPIENRSSVNSGLLFSDFNKSSSNTFEL